MEREMINELLILLCDDSPSELETAHQMVQTLMRPHEVRYSARLYSDPVVLARELPGLVPDILLLDVEMPGMNGFELAGTLRETLDDCKIIFTTGHSEFMPEAFKYRAFRYLVKPVQEQDLEEALGGAIREVLDAESLFVHDTERDAVYFIKKKHVSHIEAKGHYSVVSTMASAIGPSRRFITKRTLSQWMELLDVRFFRCHKTHILNLGEIRAITARRALLQDGTEIPVAARQEKGLQCAFDNYVRLNARFL